MIGGSLLFLSLLYETSPRFLCLMLTPPFLPSFLLLNCNLDLAPLIDSPSRRKRRNGGRPLEVPIFDEHINSISADFHFPLPLACSSSLIIHFVRALNTSVYKNILCRSSIFIMHDFEGWNRHPFEILFCE